MPKPNRWTDRNLIFLISLPRSGSTLVQRILGAYPKVHTVAESWLLLPQLYALRPDNVYAEYGHRHAATAVQEFCGHLPNGRKDYLAELSQFAVSLFERVSGDNADYFLEKTPRNVFVVDDIMQAFPNSKFIFLWRNPLAVMASMIDTFGDGKWRLYNQKADLHKGLACMIDAYQANKERVCSLHYEELVESPEDSLRAICALLELPFDASVLSRFEQVQLPGSMGDPSGTKNYQTIVRDPLRKWQNTLANPLRRQWAKAYLNWLGDERLASIGYSRAALYQELAQCPMSTRSVGSDAVRMTYGLLNNLFEARILRRKMASPIDWANVYCHR